MADKWLEDKYDDQAGYLMIEVTRAAIPIFQIQAAALVLEETPISTIDEFVMRSIRSNFGRPEDISGFLGMPLPVINAVLVDLIGKKQVVEVDDKNVRLTANGEDDLTRQEMLKPRSSQIPFFIDGFTREVLVSPPPVRHTTKETKDIGLYIFKAMPQRAPTIEEIEVEDIIQYLKKRSRRRGVTGTLPTRILKLLEIKKRTQLFQETEAIIYQSEADPQQLRLRFAIEGRISEEHGTAYAERGGIKKLEDKYKATGELLSGANTKNSKLPKKKKNDPSVIASLNKFKSEIKKKSSEEISSDRIVQNGNFPQHSDLDKASAITQSGRVSVYQHPIVLKDAIKTAKERLLIVSPWVSKAVINTEMKQNLSDLLSRNVQLTIVYGLEEKSRHHINKNTGEADLIALSKEFINFNLIYIGDTHSKILIKDSEFYITTSFNWLSYQGNPNRTFREEWGQVIDNKEQVDKFYDDLMHRYSST